MYAGRCHPLKGLFEKKPLENPKTYTNYSVNCDILRLTK